MWIRGGMILFALTLLSWGVSSFAKDHLASESEMVLIPSGSYVPFLGFEGKKNPKDKLKAIRTKPVKVPAFWIDVLPVTHRDFQKFVKEHPEWGKGKVLRLYADEKYLSDWNTNEELGAGVLPEAPVTFVSWFAALAYCESLGKTLPSVDQWEYASADRGRNRKQMDQRSIQWFGKPSHQKLPAVGVFPKNGFGVRDLHGLIWEWVQDFNQTMVAGDSRDDASGDGDLFCGAGSIGAMDPSDYPKFMRYGMRGSLKAHYSVGNLGFRCVKKEK